MVNCPCGEPVHIRKAGLCKRCYMRDYYQRNKGKPYYTHQNRARTPKPPRPRNDDIGYSGAHQRVRKARGKASDHTCADCGWQAHDWAYNGGSPLERVEQRTNRHGTTWDAPYSPDPNDFTALCKSCHAVRDGQPDPKHSAKRNRTLRQRAGQPITTYPKPRSRTW